MMTSYTVITDSYGNQLRRNPRYQYEYLGPIPSCPNHSSFTHAISSLDEIQRGDILSFRIRPGREGDGYGGARNRAGVVLTQVPHYVIGVAEKSFKLVSLGDGFTIHTGSVFLVNQLLSVFDNLDISLSDRTPRRMKASLEAIASNRRSLSEAQVQRPKM